MVRFAKNKLIIEIVCPQQNPLQLLTEYQKGIIGAIHAYAYADMSGIPSEGNLSFQVSIQRLTALLNSLMIAHDQSDAIGEEIMADDKKLKLINELALSGD